MILLPGSVRWLHRSPTEQNWIGQQSSNGTPEVKMLSRQLVIGATWDVWFFSMVINSIDFLYLLNLFYKAFVSPCWCKSVVRLLLIYIQCCQVQVYKKKQLHKNGLALDIFWESRLWNVHKLLLHFWTSLCLTDFLGKLEINYVIFPPCLKKIFWLSIILWNKQNTELPFESW